MGRVDRTKSRLYSLGISGKQFRYVEGKLPEGFSRHGKMTDRDVRNLQERGAQVLVLDSHYTSEDLKEARASCTVQAEKTPTQAEAKAPPTPARGVVASAPVPSAIGPQPMVPTPKESTLKAPASQPLTAKATTPKADDSASSPRTAEPTASAPVTASRLPMAMPPAAKVPPLRAEKSASAEGTTIAALIDISSTPSGADLYIDEKFLGHTPATTIILMPGEHKIAIKKVGFVVWKKKLKLPSGRVNVDASLVPKAK